MANNRKILISIFLISFTIRIIAAIVYLNFDSHALTMHRPFLPWGKDSNNVWRVVGHQDGYNRLAHNILTSGKIGRIPGRDPLTPPPLYPIYLAICYAIFGFNIFAFFIPQITLASINSILIIFLARRMFNDRTAILASLFYAFNPHFIFSSIQLFSETLYFFLILSVFLLCQKLLLKPLPKYVVSTGIFMALAALCRSIFLVFIPFIFIWLIIVFYREKRKMLIFLFTIFLSFSLVYGIWVIRNYKVISSDFIYFVSKTAWEIKRSKEKAAWKEEKATWKAKRAAWKEDEAAWKAKRAVDEAAWKAKRAAWKADRPSDIDELVKYRNKYRAGMVAFINAVNKNPKRHFSKGLKRLKTFLFAPCVKGVSLRHRVVSSLIFFTIYPLGYLGIAKAVRERKRIAFLVLLFITSTIIFHILTWIDGELRYRLPMELFITIFAAYGLSVILDLFCRDT